MKIRSRWIWMLAATLTGLTPAHAGPFGLSIGMTVAELKAVTNIEPAGPEYTYKATRVPVPHASFESYAFLVSPQSGLCKILALGKTLTTSIYGEEIRSDFSSLETALTEKYGRNLKFDRLKSGSIWNEPKDWMMALVKRERSLIAFWSTKEGSNMVDDIQGITLEAKALRTERGYVTLSYEFTNMTACRGEKKAVEKKAL